MKKITMFLIILLLIVLLKNLEMKPEESKIKLLKVKEFSSYEEYQKWKGIVPKPPKIKIENNTIKFFDDKGKLIKERKFNKYDEQKVKEIRTKLKDEKAIEIYYEEAKVLPNDKGILLVKSTSYYEGRESNFEIIDEKGNTIGKINKNGDIHCSPDGTYFVLLHRSGYNTTGVVDFYDTMGNLLKSEQIFDFTGMGCDVAFSIDSKNVAISLVGDRDKPNVLNKGGIAVFRNNGAVLWEKVELDLNPHKIQFSLSGELLFVSATKWGIDFKSPDTKLYAFSSADGKSLWNYPTNKQVLDIALSTSKILVFEGDNEVNILNISDGKLVKKVILPIKNKYSGPTDKFIFPGKKYILVRIIPEEFKEVIFVMSYDGEIIQQQEISKEFLEPKIGIEIHDTSFCILTKSKILLYKLKE